MSIRRFTDTKGKTKYQAQIWHNSKYYAAKTFQSEALAVAWHETQTRLVIDGKLVPAQERRVDRAAQEGLDETIDTWAQRYLAGPGLKHGDGRRYDYSLVGRLLNKTRLRAFHGDDGARLVERLVNDWKLDRRPRCAARAEDAAGVSGPAKAVKPLSGNTIRQRYFALMRIVRFAASQLPSAAAFVEPRLDRLFEFKPPAPHARPRTRIAADDEYAGVLLQLDKDPDVCALLQVLDETGCRLSEVRTATGAQIQIFDDGKVVTGGVLTLTKHKTDHSVGVREVPLSAYAAAILEGRIAQHGEGALFPGLTAEQAQDRFVAACRAADVRDLQFKDFRRTCINRLKGGISDLDLMKFAAAPAPRDLTAVSPEVRDILRVSGHRRLSTTLGYTTPDLRALCDRLTRLSRWQRVQTLLVDLRRERGSEAAPENVRQQPKAAAEPTTLDELTQRHLQLVDELQRLEAAMRFWRKAA